MYMVTHKNVNYIPKGRIPIFVGFGFNKGNYIRDNLGDNISFKNKNYCELTALYWIWKNVKDAEYISIEHYRRFFMNSFLLKPISKKRVTEFLNNYDGIVTRKYKFHVSIKKYYSDKHYSADLSVVEEAIKIMYPEYLEDYKIVMDGHETSMCNMLVLPKSKFNEYCKWLFDILFYVEKNIDISDRDDYQKRVFGFLSERLQNVWMKSNNIKVKYLPIYYLDNSLLISKLKSFKHLVK